MRKVFWINLEGSKDRRNTMEKMFAAVSRDLLSSKTARQL